MKWRKEQGGKSPTQIQHYGKLQGENPVAAPWMECSQHAQLPTNNTHWGGLKREWTGDTTARVCPNPARGEHGGATLQPISHLTAVSQGRKKISCCWTSNHGKITDAQLHSKVHTLDAIVMYSSSPKGHLRCNTDTIHLQSTTTPHWTWCMTLAPPKHKYSIKVS